MLSDVKQTSCYKLAIRVSAVLCFFWIVSWQFYPAYGIFLLIPYLIMAIVYSMTFIHSIVWGVNNRKKYNAPHLPFLICLLALILFICWPSASQSKRYHKNLSNLCIQHNSGCACNAGLYVDTYLAQSNFLASDINAVYLTDLKKFRLYIGEYDEESQQILININRNKITTIKKYNNIPGQVGIIKKQEFGLNYLKQNHVFQ